MWPFDSSYPERKAHEVAGREYDYIVVGGGTAGCAVASRLSDDPNVSVLVLERGAVGDHWLSRVPLLSGSLGPFLQVVRRVSEPMKECNGRQTDIWTGEALGGASRVNQMLYTRGVPGMYNEWAEMGHPDWSWEKVEPFFKRVENSVSHPEARHLGHDGPVRIVQHLPQFELHNHIDKSASAVGLPVEWDVNCPSGSASGYFYLDYTIDQNGHRHSSYRAYLPQKLAIARQSRLTVCTGVIASRLELDADKGIATGVHMKAVGSKAGQEVLVKARREVIVCSGAVCSAQLLMLSGIGSSKHLSSHGIQVKKDLPGVGTNLSDHHGLPIMLKLPIIESYHRMESNFVYAIWQMLRFAWNQSGWLKAGTTSSAIYLKTSHLDNETSTFRPGPGDPEFDASKPENVPDVEIMLIPAGTIVGKYPGVPLFTLYTCLIQPETVGHIELASLDPADSPRIYYKMMENPRDFLTARKALRFTLNLAEQFAETSGYRHPVELFYGPGAGTGRKWNDIGDDELDDFVRTSAQSVVHLGCSCRMAKEEDGGVVDDELRVYGFRNLRIADASVFPKIPAAHTMAPTYMVAERCAQFIKDTWSSNE
jgi:choline dehydrogenase-like flavoprotein